jgi:hypothetical protein
MINFINGELYYKLPSSNTGFLCKSVKEFKIRPANAFKNTQQVATIIPSLSGRLRDFILDANPFPHLTFAGLFSSRFMQSSPENAGKSW